MSGGTAGCPCGIRSPRSRAGQTAPSPGITFIRGGINIQTHDVSNNIIAEGLSNSTHHKELHAADNLAFDRAGNPVRLITENTRDGGKIVERPPRFYWPDGLEPLPVAQVQEHVLRDAGARPWDRDAVDARIVREARAGTGRVINSEQDAGGYPIAKETRQVFNPDAWDLRTMTRRAAPGG